MSILIGDRNITRVGVVDDNPAAREGYTYTLEDAELVPHEEIGPLGDLNSLLKRVASEVDAVLCDFHLRHSNYATFDGAELAAGFFQKSVPTVLCTRYEEADLDTLRKFRHEIPALIKPDDLTPDSLFEALALAIREIEGDPVPERRLWRTQIHIAEVLPPDEPYFFVGLPGWTSSDVIRLRKDSLPPGLVDRLQEDARWHAQVNIGAVDASDLFFQDWESR
jgi:CheY-like chemotaxis protein